MNPTTAITHEVQSLIEAVCDGIADDAQVRNLESILLTDQEACKFYIYLLDLDAKLQWLGGSLQEGDAALKELIAAKQTSPQQTAITSPATMWHGMSGYFSSDWSVAYLVATVIFAIGMTIASFVTVTHYTQIAQQTNLLKTPSPQSLIPNPSPKAPLVGHITGMLDCQFEKTSEISPPKTQDPRPKTPVSLGDRFALRSGLLEITYDSGAKVILQGPVTYEVDSKDGGYLSLGKLTAKLEKSTEDITSGPSSIRHSDFDIWHSSSNPSLSIIHYPLFTIKTPTAIITDLGTEFGVEVSDEGNTTSHVYRGSVRLQVASSDGKQEGTAKILHQNESARVESGGDQNNAKRITTLDPSVKPIDFIREIRKQNVRAFDLVDVLAGGDGFSGRRGAGIDPRDGRLVDEAHNAASGSPWSGDGQYHRVPGRPFVDGVFIPNGGKVAVQIDSAGHICDDFPATANSTWQAIWAGGQFGADDPTTIDDVDYASAGHGLIYLNGDSAVTFDLEAVRRANRGWKVRRFLAVAANTCNDINCYADIWVLVDGKKLFQCRQINSSSGGFSVQLPIGDKDRFLTLAATDAGDGIHFDLIAFGDPRLELIPAKTTTDPTPPPEAAEH